MWPPGFTSGPLIDFARETGRAGQLLHVEEARGFVRLVANLADAVASVVGRITPPAKLIPAQIMSKLSWHTHHTHAHTHAHTRARIHPHTRTHTHEATRAHARPHAGRRPPARRPGTPPPPRRRPAAAPAEPRRGPAAGSARVGRCDSGQIVLNL